MRYFEDVVVGERIDSVTSFELTRDEIVGFCAKWDPLPFHVDEEAAAGSAVGKLFTSAIHTLAIGSRLIHEVGGEPMAIVAGLGWDKVRFLAPACVGDTLRARCAVIEARASSAKPDRGVVRFLIEVINQHDATVVSFESAILVFRRGADGTPAA